MTVAKYSGEDRRAPEPVGWHLDKRVPISLIITIMIIAGSGIGAFFKHETSIELLKAGFEVLHDRDLKQENDFREALSQMRDLYKEMNAKLDRLIELRMKKPG